MFPFEFDFMTLIPGALVTDSNRRSLGGFSFGHSLDLVEHNRSIYHFLDFLGDVGGLLSILEGIGQFFVLLFMKFAGSSLNQFLIGQIMSESTLFYSDGKLVKGVSKRAKQKCCRTKGATERHERALQVMMQELDVVTLIRKQMMFDVVLKTIFSGAE